MSKVAHFDAVSPSVPVASYAVYKIHCFNTGNYPFMGLPKFFYLFWVTPKITGGLCPLKSPHGLTTEPRLS